MPQQEQTKELIFAVSLGNIDMSRLTAGGSATSAGIDYQQRVAACFQIFLYTGFQLSHVLHENFRFAIRSLHFETAHPIDDLMLVCEQNHTLYLQIKRSITFSDAAESDFLKTIRQFISQYKGRTEKQSFVLVTSSECSRRISFELNKILQSIRLNDESFQLNPLNKSEQEVYEKFRQIFHSLFLEVHQQDASETAFIDFSKKVYIELMDVEAGKPLEKSCLMLLSGIVQSPDLIWSLLIKNSLHYSKSRASINKSALSDILKRFEVSRAKSFSNGDDDFAELLQDSIITTGDYACDREILILESERPNDYFVIGLNRFDITCSKKFKFCNNKIYISSLDREFAILFRGSSIVGLERFIEQNTELFKDKSVTFYQGEPKSDSDYEDDCTKLYREYLEGLARANKNIRRCLHCDKIVGRTNNLLVEIDDDDSQSAFGVIHSNCRRPMDRVLGLMDLEGEAKSQYLEGFDFKEWISLSIKGGILVGGMSSTLKKGAMIFWNSMSPVETEGDFCVRFLLEDGTVRFAFHRGRIERMSESEARDRVEKFNNHVEKSRSENDPLCFTTKNVTYGTYSMLLQSKLDDEEITEIISASPARYSKQVAQMQESGRMFYAPLCLVTGIEDGGILNIGNMVPIISDPLKIDQLAKSWQKAGVEVGMIELKVLKSDNEVDRYLSGLFDDGMLPVLDPVLDKSAKLIGGNPFAHMQRELARREFEEEQEGFEQIKPTANPKWKRHDLVLIAFPDQAEKMYGRLLDDEVENAAGEHLVIFRPVENGEDVEDVNLVIPIKFVFPWDGVQD